MAKLYVAYGSNLNKEQMKDRCPGAEFVGTGSIENYELQFKGSLHGAHATIAPKEGSSVPVGMWTIKKRDESRLDMYEGYNLKGYCYYNKEQIPVKMDDGSTLIGWFTSWILGWILETPVKTITISFVRAMRTAVWTPMCWIMR